MAIRGAAILFFGAAFITACTAVLGVDDVPTAPARDAGASSSDAGGNNTDANTTSDLGTAINAYAAAYCAKYRECFRPGFDLSYKDLDECTSANAQIPTRNAGLPGATATAADFQGCATKTAALTCDAFNSSDSSSACVLKGSRKNGDKCVEGLQCESGVCATSTSKCRTCIAARERGADCSQDNTCGPGLTCNGSVCVTESLINQTCDAQKQPCVGNLVCASGTCIRQPDVSGATCDDKVGCALDRGLVCQAGHCISVIINGPDGECDYSPATVGAQPKFCRRFAACKQGKCATPPKEGEPCGEVGSGKGFCLEPLSCQNGLCSKPPPSSFCE